MGQLQWFAGTSGFSYKQWRGPFYPKEVAQKDWLAYYASQLPAVEINNTFYRLPRTNVIESWRDSVPETFRFVIKASRRITHSAKLKDAHDPLAFLLGNVRHLENRLGAVLFQTPPYLRMDLELLKNFQGSIPDDIPVAFEFRHRSWLDEHIFASIRDHGHALVSMDEAEDPAPVCAGAWCYLRLRKSTYSDDELRTWHQQVSDAQVATAFAFFKHEDDGAAPELARRYLQLDAGTAAD